MLKALRERLRQGHRTAAFPDSPPVMPERFRGLPVITPERCQEGCARCVEACPTDAMSSGPLGPTVDLGRCLFCVECTAACPGGALAFSTEHRMAARSREDLMTTARGMKLAQELDVRSSQLFGRSLKLRQVSAGGCNACEAEVNVLNTVVFDLSRFGIGFVASPRHADGLLITGPVTENMRSALRSTYEAVPGPKLVIAVGACAISGGPFAGNPEQHDGAGSTVPVDLYVPGCPPHPYTILDGVLRLLGRMPRGT